MRLFSTTIWGVFLMSSLSSIPVEGPFNTWKTSEECRGHLTNVMNNYNRDRQETFYTPSGALYYFDCIEGIHNDGPSS